jgi:hypothetical protein
MFVAQTTSNRGITGTSETFSNSKYYKRKEKLSFIKIYE